MWTRPRDLGTSDLAQRRAASAEGHRWLQAHRDGPQNHAGKRSAGPGSRPREGSSMGLTRAHSPTWATLSSAPTPARSDPGAWPGSPRSAQQPGWEAGGKLGPGGAVSVRGLASRARAERGSPFPSACPHGAVACHLCSRLLPFLRLRTVRGCLRHRADQSPSLRPLHLKWCRPEKGSSRICPSFPGTKDNLRDFRAVIEGPRRSGCSRHLRSLISRCQTERPGKTRPRQPALTRPRRCGHRHPAKSARCPRGL